MKMILYIPRMALIILLVQSCIEKDDCHHDLLVVNNSNAEVWLAESGLQHSGLNCRQIPGLIPAGESYNYDLRGCWEDQINKGYRGAVVFYFFDENYFLTHPECDSIEFNQSVIEKRSYTVEDLDSLGWVIEYQ